MILRTSWVFGAHGNNFVKTMLRLGRERDELSVVADQQGCPTSAASIARALWTLAQQYRESGALQWGLYHYSGLPACSWHGFAQEIFAQAHGLGMLPRVPVVHGISTAQYPTPAKRPAWSVMDCSRLQKAQQIAHADWRDELRAVLLKLAGQ
jgi:dTDP-4-dehydrorhamnose reductase